MTRPLAIVGAGGFGREIRDYARDLDLEVGGFVDDHADSLASFGIPEPVLGRLEDVRIADFDWIVGIGNPEVRRSFYQRLTAAGASFYTLIHPTAYVAPTASVGSGSVVCPFAFVSSHAVVEANVVVNNFASVSHDCRVAAHTVLSPYTALNGTITVGEGAFFGTNATVLPGLTVGRFSKIGAGAVVTKSVPDASLVVGVPGVVRRTLEVPSD